MENSTQNYLPLTTLPLRNKGTIESKFRKLVIDSNRYKVNVSKLSYLCIFAIKFTPDVKDEQRELKDQIIKKITPQIEEFVQQPIIKDGLIFTHTTPKLRDKTIIYEEYIIMIREVNRFDAHKNPEMVQYFLGNVMRRVMQKLNYVEVGASKKFINMKNCMEIENVLVFSGFKVAFEMLENGYYLTVDTTKKIVRYESVLEFITYLYKINQNRQRNAKRELVKQALIGRIVMTNYGKTRYLKVQDVVFIDLTQIEIESQKMFLPEYYKKRYDIEIKNLKQPLLYANAKRTNIKTYLVPQLCLMTGIPEDFDEIKNKRITESAKLSAEDRKKQIQKFVGGMNEGESDIVFKVLGVEIRTSSQKIEGKIIPAPKIMLGEGKTVAAGKQAAFPMHQSPIFKVKDKPKMAVITFDGIDANTLIQYFINSFKLLKVKVDITVIKGDNFNHKRAIDSISILIQKAKQQQKCDICIILIPNRMRNYYQKIKQLTLLQKQISCQLVVESTLKNKNLYSVALKIFLQVLVKLGNILWVARPYYQQNNIMFVSYYSCQINKYKCNSFTLAICATVDDLYAEIYSKCCRYLKEHEELQCMSQLLLQALVNYKNKNGYIPENIIILENQKPSRTQGTTLQFFIEPSIKYMGEVYGSRRPKLTYLIMRKSLHDRFFRLFQGKHINPPIGTLINSHLIASKFQFYMISHNICKKGGSIIPLNYKVVFSDSDIEEGVIYCLLYSQCFSYANYSGAIRQPALLQYVTKCARFGAEVLKNCQVCEKFRMLPYYI